MKILVALLLVSNLAVIWLFFLRGNVRFNYGKRNDAVQAELEIMETERSDDHLSDESLVEKSTIKISELRSAVAEILPAMVKDEVKEYLQESDTEFDDEFHPSRHRFKPVDNVEKAFEDIRTEGPAEGQPVAQGEDDDTIPAFDDLDKGMRTIKDPSANDEEKKQAVNAMLSIEGTNLVMALPEPLHSKFINLITSYTAAQIDKEEKTVSQEASSKEVSPKSRKTKPLPDNIKDFNIRDYKNQ